jgi:hypothetical protein
LLNAAVAAATARKKASRFSTGSEAAAFISSVSYASVNDTAVEAAR